ncbi:MAG TPA: glycosyltransferase family 2 protein [Thermoanaerobaculia bacterium]|nr:glycosyltransferase family 2 protein [Thermoanaerobaculia bacterium]
MNNAPTDKSNAVRDEQERTRLAEARDGERGRPQQDDEQERTGRLPSDPYAPSTDAPPAWDVSAIVVNRDGGAALDRCLESLASQQGIAMEVLVVDNASAGGEADAVRARFPGIRVVPLTANLGFAGGVNEGIARTAAPFVLVVNNDARLAPDYAARLAARLSFDERLAGVQGLVLREDGATIDTAGLSWNARGEAVPLHAGDERFAAPTEAIEVPGVSATAAMYRREALADVGAGGRVFDDSFFAYYEDVDLSLRLARSGWRFALDPEAIAFHRGSMTGGRTPWRRALWIAQNRWRTLLKNFDHAFLRRRLGDLLRADLAHARALGGAGWLLPLIVWPAAAWRALRERRKEPLLTGFPASPPRRP